MLWDVLGNRIGSPGDLTISWFNFLQNCFEAVFLERVPPQKSRDLSLENSDSVGIIYRLEFLFIEHRDRVFTPPTPSQFHICVFLRGDVGLSTQHFTGFFGSITRSAITVSSSKCSTFP